MQISRFQTSGSDPGGDFGTQNSILRSKNANSFNQHRTNRKQKFEMFGNVWMFGKCWKFLDFVLNILDCFYLFFWMFWKMLENADIVWNKLKNFGKCLENLGK